MVKLGLFGGSILMHLKLSTNYKGCFFDSVNFQMNVIPHVFFTNEPVKLRTQLKSCLVDKNQVLGMVTS